MPAAVTTQFVPAPRPDFPALAIQLTQLVDSCMVWVGATDVTTEAEVQRAVSQGKLGADWAVAMPTTTAGTLLMQTTTSDIALSMAQRLARRFRLQVFLSVDLPLSFLSTGQSVDLVLHVEKSVTAVLKDSAQTT